MKRGLQIAVIIFGCVPVFGGLAGVVLGPLMAGDVAGSVSQDSHFRYLSGLLLGIGLVFWSLVPRLEREGRLFRVLTLIVVLGGLSRLGGVVVLGLPSPSMMFGLAMELVITPLLCLWQYRLEIRPPQT
jgi:hypothetical protein